jgi:hypothetical protein
MRYLFLILLCSGLNSYTFAQRITSGERTSISFGTQLEIPSGEYNYIHNHNQLNIGIGGSFLTRTKLPLFQSGINFTYAKTGKYIKDIFLETNEYAAGNPIYQIADFSVKHRIYRTHGMLRFKPFKGPIQPYLDGMAGVKMFSSTAKTEQGQGRDSYVIGRENIERHFAASLGWALGLKVRLTRRAFLEGRFEKLEGGHASYIDADSFLLNPQGGYDYDLRNSKTNSTLIHLGVSLDL